VAGKVVSTRPRDRKAGAGADPDDEEDLPLRQEDPRKVGKAGKAGKAGKVGKAGKAGAGADRYPDDEEEIQLPLPQLPRGLSAPAQHDQRRVSKLQTANCGHVSMVEYDALTHDHTNITIQEGSVFTVQSKEQGPVQVLVLIPCTLTAQGAAEKTVAFGICVTRCVDEKNNPLSGFALKSMNEADTVAAYKATTWGPPMLSNFARFYGNKCVGCDFTVAAKAKYSKAFEGLTMSSWQSSAMQLRPMPSSSSLRESRVAEEFWQAIVNFEGRVVVAKSKFTLSNKDTQLSDDDVEDLTVEDPVNDKVAKDKVVKNKVAKDKVVAKGNVGSDKVPNTPGPTRTSPRETPTRPTMPPDPWAVVAIPSPPPLDPFSAAAGSQLGMPMYTYSRMMLDAMANQGSNQAFQTVARVPAAPTRTEELHNNMVLQQSRQLSAMCNNLFEVAKMAINSRSNTAGTPTAVSSAPAPPTSEEVIAAWLTANKIKFDDLVVNKLMAIGVEDGAQILMLDKEDWESCGFLKLPVLLLAQLKKKAQ
jgi:hypothetical protein